ncbi:hypothetical protein ACPV3O_23350 [Vibrio rotiferianus]|uniref:hypothetical protein n=1 Tax=Vibrio rotiferianus TaxID=190895 RepID=UPI00406A6026
MMPWVVSTDDTRHLEAQAHLYSVDAASSCLSQPEPKTVGSSNHAATLWLSQFSMFQCYLSRNDSAK